MVRKHEASHQHKCHESDCSVSGYHFSANSSRPNEATVEEHSALNKPTRQDTDTLRSSSHYQQTTKNPPLSVASLSGYSCKMELTR